MACEASQLEAEFLQNNYAHHLTHYFTECREHLVDDVV